MKSKVHHFTFQLPEKVRIEKKGHVFHFSGPLGHTRLNMQTIDPKGSGALLLNQQKNQLEVISSSKCSFGLFLQLIENKIQGVTRGFLVYLKILGIGYRAQLINKTLVMKLGYSHDIVYKIPCSIKVFLVEPTLVCLFGLDKNQITQIAAKLRDLRPPSAYKGKGIRLVSEEVVLKQGKKK